MIGTIARLLLPLLVAAPAGAAVYGGSNFGSYDYPGHNCGNPPYPPTRPYDMTSTREVEAYNRQVDAYNVQIRSYSECINAYVGRAERDMHRIREKADAAAAEMRRVNEQTQQRGYR